MKLQKTLVLAAAILFAIGSLPAWAYGPGGRGPGGGHGSRGCIGGPGGRGGCFGGRGFHNFNRGGGTVVFAGGGYNNPYYGGYWGGYGGYPYYGAGCGYGGYGAMSAAATPAYYINYSPYITTGAIPQAAVTPAVAECTTNGGGLASGDIVGNVQRALRQRGFYSGPIDGLAGPTTRAAIRAYAGKCGLPATGIIDAQLLTSLGLM